MRSALLLAEAVAALLLAATVVHLLPRRWLRRLGGAASAVGEGREPAAPLALARARAVTGRMARVAGRLPWRSTCLVRALAGRMLLARRRIAGGRIRLGVRLHEGRLEAHAWLLLGPDILLGGEAADFTPLADLAHGP